MMSTELVALTPAEDTFALGVIEYNGNIGAAYRAAYGSEAKYAIAKGKELLCRPEIAKRIAQLQELVNEQALISLGSHLGMLAEIRDQAIVTGELKVALNAEKSRGEVAGFYQGKGAGGRGNEGGGQPAVHIHMGAATPVNVHQWAEQHGKAPLIIEMPKG
jgi:hypothetical protein